MPILKNSSASPRYHRWLRVRSNIIGEMGLALADGGVRGRVKRVIGRDLLDPAGGGMGKFRSVDESAPLLTVPASDSLSLSTSLSHSPSSLSVLVAAAAAAAAEAAALPAVPTEYARWRRGCRARDVWCRSGREKLLYVLPNRPPLTMARIASFRTRRAVLDRPVASGSWKTIV